MTGVSRGYRGTCGHHVTLTIGAEGGNVAVEAAAAAVGTEAVATAAVGTKDPENHLGLGSHPQQPPGEQ